MKIFLYSLILFVAIAQQTVSETKTITLYSYLAAPPFVINAAKEKGVNFDLVRAIQRRAPEGIKYRYEYIQRTELNKRLAAGEPAIVLWANPIWFEKGKEPSFLWSHPLFWDKDVIVGLKDSKLSYSTFEDLIGLRLGGISGFFYHTIDAMAEEKSIIRLNADSHSDNIQRLLDGKVDVIIISKSSLLYYVRNLQLISEIVIIGKPHSSFKRHLLVTKHFKGYLDLLNSDLRELSQDVGWRDRLTIYGLQDLWLSPDSENVD